MHHPQCTIKTGFCALFPAHFDVCSLSNVAFFFFLTIAESAAGVVVVAADGTLPIA
jgi:hypothetical protein